MESMTSYLKRNTERNTCSLLLSLENTVRRIARLVCPTSSLLPHSGLHCTALLFCKHACKSKVYKEQIACFKDIPQTEVKSCPQTHTLAHVTRETGDELARPHLPCPPSTSLIVMVTISTSAASRIQVFTPHAVILFITPSSFLYSCTESCSY